MNGFDQLEEEIRNDMDELSPCPFCGSTYISFDNTIDVRYVYCQSCGCKGGKVFDFEGDLFNRRTVIKRWNKRVVVEDVRSDKPGSTFLVCQKQRNVGCDYTIGCGYRFDWMEAESLEQLMTSIVWPDRPDGRSPIEDENPLETILIIPAANVVAVDTKTIADGFVAVRTEERRKQIKAAELATLKKLQEKYQGVREE